ncbi:unnamed protein product (macronuclear) [Paramecium tetraurelia]|uniref:Uncharacterized protein n=1 Tax=Paramecium tetraurelia TaxID=5888 RepID=A0D582_PARTE|nr:uncharacterized protein GSPATT00013646001 [Paramecium tetraurelia]CAK78199.1 unnamed protein product [Paramecium tetraurelia]|eukprot:XP_001445596.1 hypothetical protein (macronuclear) [Paramecium tetraurelia strain d4-2]
MKCFCKNKPKKDLVISIKDDNVIFQTCNNTQNVICKFQGFYDFSDSSDNDNQIIRLMSQISNKDFDKNSFKQILEINTNCSQDSKLFINNETNFRLVSSTQSTSTSSPTLTEPKKKKKQKPQNKKSQPKSEVEKKPQQISDSKNQTKQNKVCSMENEDIRIFEERIKQYTSEVDDSQKIVLNLPLEWIKKFGIQKKKK